MCQRKFIRNNLKIILFLTVAIACFSCRQDCPDGYSGEDCEIAASDKFIGVYEGTINCGFVDQYTTMEIEKNIGAFDIWVYMTEPSEFVLTASVLEDTLFIKDQTVGVPIINDTLYYNFIESKGLLTNDTLHFPISFVIDDPVDPTTITCALKLIK